MVIREEAEEDDYERDLEPIQTFKHKNMMLTENQVDDIYNTSTHEVPA